MSEETKPKICRDCKHHRSIIPSTGNEVADMLRSFYGMNYHMDVCAQENRTDPVDGKPVYSVCKVSRKVGGHCGLSGLYFEPKEAQ